MYAHVIMQNELWFGRHISYQVYWNKFWFFFSKSEINVRTIMLLCRMKCDLEGTSAFCLSLFCDSPWVEIFYYMNFTFSSSAQWYGLLWSYTRVGCWSTSPPLLTSKPKISPRMPLYQRHSPLMKVGKLPALYRVSRAVPGGSRVSWWTRMGRSDTRMWSCGTTCPTNTGPPCSPITTSVSTESKRTQ